MTLSRPGWRAIALVVAVTFFWIALRADIDNATAPQDFTQRILHVNAQLAHPWWLSVHFWLRKAYSVVAFTLVTFCAQRALGSSTRPALRAAIIGGVYSLAIEFAQHAFVAVEPIVESAFDVGCGAFGGCLAITVDREWSAHGRSPVVPTLAPPLHRDD